MNTPNPNPSPECVYLGAIKKGTAFIMDYGVADAEELVRVADVQPADDVCCKVRLEGVTFWTPEFEFRRRATPVAALSQTLPAPGEVEQQARLLLRRQVGDGEKGVSVWWGGNPDIPAHAALRAIEAALATVAAANDEGVARIRRAIWGYVNAQPEDAAMLPVVQFLANRDVFLAEAIALATSRSQHEGASS